MNVVHGPNGAIKSPENQGVEVIRATKPGTQFRALKRRGLAGGYAKVNGFTIGEVNPQRCGCAPVGFPLTLRGGGFVRED
jgi:hypothetical protein